MRERVRHGEVGRREIEGEGAGPGIRRRTGPWRVTRRYGRGPRPVRPGAPAVAVRPPEPPRPAGPVGGVGAGEGWWGGPAGLRLLARPAPGAVRCGGRYLVRRTVAGIALVAASAAAVVMLGLLARTVAPLESPVAPAPAVEIASPAAPVVVTSAPGETVWEVADRVAPGLSGSQRAELAERIVTENGLASARLQPGQVLRVPVG